VCPLGTQFERSADSHAKCLAIPAELYKRLEGELASESSVTPPRSRETNKRRRDPPNALEGHLFGGSKLGHAGEKRRGNWRPIPGALLDHNSGDLYLGRRTIHKSRTGKKVARLEQLYQKEMRRRRVAKGHYCASRFSGAPPITSQTRRGQSVGVREGDERARREQVAQGPSPRKFGSRGHPPTM